MVSLLISHGAQLEAREVEGCTPLHHTRSADTTLVLLGAGANPDSTCSGGSTILHHLAFFRNMSPKKSLAMRALVQGGADCDVLNHCRYSPILSATLVGNLEAIQHLHALGADVTMASTNGLTILHYTVFWHGFQQLQLLREIDICGIDPDAAVLGGSVVQAF